MRLLIVATVAPLLMGCPANIGETGADSLWPEILPEYQDYDAIGGGQVGDRIAPFALPDQTGSEVDFRQFLGFVTLIDIGASWCIPCQDAASTQQALLEELQDDGPVWILSVLVQDATTGPPDPADSAEWAAQFGLELPVLADILQAQQTDWQVVDWPTQLVVAPDGTVLHRHEGAADEAVLADQIRAALSDHEADLRQ